MAPPSAGPLDVVRRCTHTWWSAGFVVLVAYLGLSFLNDSRGLLGTDTGIKVATLETMQAQGTWRPEIGYWAAQWDPEASVHPYLDTHPTAKAGYVDASTLPMLLAAYPLWSLGGYRLTLLLPMLGAVGAAFVGRGLSRWAGGPDDGWPAFWLVALASPLVVYALDLWEHTVGVALIGAAVLLLTRALDRPTWCAGLVAGGLFGLAFAMRTEALVYTAAAFAVVVAVLARRRRWAGAALIGTTGVVGFAALFVANNALESLVVGSSIRSGRASGTAISGGSGLGVRLREAVVTSFSPFPTFEVSYVLIGVSASLGLVALALSGRSPSGRYRSVAVALAVLVTSVLVGRLQFGLGFWPGLLPTTPVAAVGVALGWSDGRRRLLAAIGLLALPVVFYFQYTGGALPQWGGRYLLPSGFLLLVAGAAALPHVESWVRVAFVGFSVLATSSGVFWLQQRTHQVAAAGEVLQARPESVLVSPEGFPPREFAAWYGEKDWLAVRDRKDLPLTADVVRRSGRRTFALVEVQPGPVTEFPGFRRVGTTTLPFVDPATLTVTTYEATA